nr:MAG TPA: hypothetical protein [Caudoviricetes sp.]
MSLNNKKSLTKTFNNFILSSSTNNKALNHTRKKVIGKMVLNTAEKDLLKTFKEILPKMGGESKAYLLGYGEGYKKKAEESEKEEERKEET